MDLHICKVYLFFCKPNSFWYKNREFSSRIFPGGDPVFWYFLSTAKRKSFHFKFISAAKLLIFCHFEGVYSDGEAKPQNLPEYYGCNNPR